MKAPGATTLSRGLGWVGSYVLRETTTARAVLSAATLTRDECGLSATAQTKATSRQLLAFAALNASQAAWKSAPARAWRPSLDQADSGIFGTNSAFWRSSPDGR